MRLSVTIQLRSTKKSLSLRGCTHSSKLHITPSTGCLEECQSRIGHCGDDQSWLHHDAWREHRKIPRWLRAMVFLRSGGSRIFRFHLTIRSGGIRSFVNEHLFRLKVIQWAWSFLDVTSGVREEVLRQGMLPTTIPLPPPPYSLWPSHASKHDWCIVSEEILARVKSPSGTMISSLVDDGDHDFFPCGRTSNKFVDRNILPGAQRTWKRLIKLTCKKQQN